MAGGAQECTDARASTAAPTTADALVAARAAQGDLPLETLHDLLLRVTTRAPVGWRHDDPADPKLLPETVRRAEELRAAIAALLLEAVAAGSLEASTDVRALARAVHVAHAGSAVVWSAVGRGPFAVALREDVDAALAPHRVPRTD